MWLSGIGLKLFAWQRGLSSDQLLGIEPTKPGVLNDAVTAGVLPLAFVIALCIALDYVLLNRIAGRKIALVGSCLLALNPFYITYSKVLHVDALLATFMLTSVLFLLNYLCQSNCLNLILSGVFAGLAFLTKSPSLFLIPYAILVVGVYKMAVPGTGWLHRLWEVIRALLIWGGITAVVFVALWPAMWVEPLDALRRIGARVIFHIETAHRNPVFFNGKITFENPGLPFYLATVAWKTTLVTLPMAGTALVSALPRPRRGEHSKVVLLLTAYVVCFTIQMGLSAQKELAYLLPVFPALDVIAAFGLVQSAGAIGRLRCKWRWLPTAFVALALAIQAVVVLPRHPYYGTHHNHLLGGSRVAQRVLPLQDQGEGLDLAAQYLNTLPRAQRASAGLHRSSAAIFRLNFVGLTSVVSDPRANYRVYYVN
jgi:4-amino-4-deoxy-L-arabinose transferase-like glycosyltransferase